jgi:hypothetical protein
MKNLQIFLTCLLEDFEAVIFFTLGIWFAWILMFQNSFAWYFVAGVILLGVIFNVLTELIWWRKK